jgi:hypothetical protein
MNAWELVTIVVSVVAVLIAATTYFRLSNVLQDLGRHGRDWFEHPEDRELEDRPSDDERDEPIPKRRLRGRPG